MKWASYKGDCFVSFFHPPVKTCQQKNVILMNKIANQNKGVSYGKLLFGWFLSPSFGNHGTHTLVYHYPLFESGKKTDL